MSFSLQEILIGARRSDLRVSAELTGFLSLAVAEQVRREPREFKPAEILLEPTGSLTVNTPLGDPALAEMAIRSWLGQLLAAAGAECGPLEAVAARSGQGPESLCSELCAALVPLNRGAARRALCRLYRRLSELPEDLSRGDELLEFAPEPASYVHEPIPLQARSVHVTRRADATKPTWPAENQRPAKAEDSSGELTPIFGSVLVAPAPSPQAGDHDRMPFSVWKPSPTPEPLPAKPAVTEYVAAWTPRPSNAVLRDEPSVVIEDRDSVISETRRTAGASAKAPIFERFAPRKSDVDQLLGDFGVARPTAERRIEQQLRELAGVEPALLTPRGPSAASRTPPPVQLSGHPNKSEVTARNMKPVFALAGCGVLAATAGFWPLQPNLLGAAAGPACAADMEVRAQAGTEVRLVSPSQKTRRSGPVARFEAVSCDQDVEIIVLLAPPDPERAFTFSRAKLTTETAGPESGGWMRVPVPSARLRAAADSGEPLVISVFGR
ncbi:MAG: hypothetical protein RJA70_3989 [Pseudomonadota bacterium]|jgi:hypothetical protein